MVSKVTVLSTLFIAIAGFVFLLSFVTTAYLCSPASRFLLLDQPNERSLHTRLTPRTGGLAIILSLVIGIAGMAGSRWACGARCGNGELPNGRVILWLAIAALSVVIVSFSDDIMGLPVAIRFGVHTLAALGIVWGAGLVIPAIPFPAIGVVWLGWSSVPLSALFIMWMTNLYNFMDGMDGFAGGMTIIGFGFMSYLGWNGGDYLIAMLSLLIAAAASGFLFFNLPPARVFMGDVGSTALGFLAGALAVMGVHHGLFDIWVPVLIFSPFIVDATATLLRRLTRAQRPWQPHREHYYQRLVLAGLGHRKTVLSEYVLMVAAGLSGVLYQQASNETKLGILIGWGCLYFIIALSIGRIIGRRKLSDRVGSSASSGSIEMREFKI